ncbi:response regulator transcription factor [Myroides marinus]|uniref:DNA-binding response regulator, OmpR family, contains REC and winged-helix (WHTH) domain n=1 Tax=Myroides marinus TaxID=703342 RepID=A0A161SCD8_9FLAO|nr:response regulator transcription factor [Myroides marinus]KZE78035.1 two-component system response regulator [Myroides marinus]MDM1379462.1 response regulator transcription factor [Myroides marinus]MDM1386733.1 response regulator transcription factor [Myroides marinus]MDM1393946.1 response regulator transcription factor [Myroides marinus]SEI70501.1 DNA-binding response regulator, OmpR family, contains REC and winged-helix (wHTH) domain [Myroides marinus]
MNILLVEDDTRISDFIVKGLEENGMQVELAASGEQARDLILGADWDLILMDVMLPGIDGIQLTKMIRFKKNYTPILMLSALSETTDKISALDSGADDYLTKPFHFSELLSRINALTRRTKFNYEKKEHFYICRNLKIDPEKHLVTQNNKQIDLSPREYKLLLFLLENKDKVVSRMQILERVWGIQFDTNTNVVDVYISYLRNKIDESEGKIIHTIKGTGYMLQE